MALLSRVEASIALGVSVELLEWFVKKCPKPGEDRKLRVVKAGGEVHFEESEIAAFRAYLAAPWPLPAKGKRPELPDAIRDDVRRESHLSCAICGHVSPAHANCCRGRPSNGHCTASATIYCLNNKGRGDAVQKCLPTSRWGISL